MADWSRAFDDPNPRPRGRQLITLKDARAGSRGVAGRETLLLVVELNGRTMMAHIGVMRAFNRNVEREFDSSRKDKHWGKRKRDQ